MLTVAEPLALVPAGGGYDLMSRRPRCSRFGQIFAVKILDVVGWKPLRGQRIKKINKLLISASFRGQRIAKRGLRPRFSRVLALDRRRIV